MARIEPVVLIIMDGWGIAPEGPGNAVTLAKTPVVDALWEKYPHTQLEASGTRVGLPAGQMGNSEVGHLNIGAGRVVYQDLVRISLAVQDGTFFENPALLRAINHVREHDSKLHLLGLLGPGGVHSHIDHLYALLSLVAKHHVKKVEVHPILDGRDTPPQSGLGYIKELEQRIATLGTGRIATVAGRYYTMDRDKRWDRVEKAYRCMVFGEGNSGPSAEAIVEKSYADGVTDEFVIPSVVRETPEKGEESLIRPHDALIFFNFRTDRTREITRALVMDDFPFFNRGPKIEGLDVITMTEYEEGLPVTVAYPSEFLNEVLADVLAEHDICQFHTAETEKYAHVTFFLNGGREEPFPEEDRKLIPSPKVATYDLQPEMSAHEVTQVVLDVLKQGHHQFIIINYANGDMVGHTGSIPAAIKAVETVDEGVGKIVDAVLAHAGAALVTADHGNAEEMIDPATGGPWTAHTTNPVPFILVCERTKGMRLRDGGALSDIAPTIFDLMGIPKPDLMTGRSLIVK
ncbi:MAG TPA: 2,3-bisphosphoglycerate-independent phosphoglycerate mutase [Chloroflexota bacterium]|nr:2,3-bisphosphoglycerate-independent phosphoglycerate mutase [Chloroflexota bacterium]